MQEFRGERYFDNEVDRFNGIPLKIILSLNLHYLFTFHPDFLKSNYYLNDGSRGR